MYTMQTHFRLSAWRNYKYRQPTDGPLPPAWFKRSHECTAREGKMHYGDGLGGDGERCRPFRVKGLASEVIDPCRAYGCEYTTDDEATTYRGVVFQIPARDGRPLYLPGCEWGESLRKGFDMGGGWIEYGGRNAAYESASDAARRASDMAERACESENEEREAERREEEEAERLASLYASSECGND